MNRFYITICFVFILFLGHVEAQKDSTYVKTEITTYTLGLNTMSRLYNVDFISFDRDYWSVNKKDLSIGIRTRYKWVNLVVIFAFYDFNNEQVFSPDFLNVDLKLYPKSFYIKSNIQYTSLLGSVHSDLLKLSDINKKSKLFSMSIWGAYLFNADQISLSSAYSFVDRQKKSAGSWFISSFIEEHRFFINIEDYESLGFQDADRLNALYKTRLGLGSGYTQSLVWNDLVWNGLISGGIETFRIHSKNETLKNETEYAINPNIRMNTSLVYYLGDHYLAIIGEYYPAVFKSSTKLDLEKNFGWIRFSYGFKF